MVKASYGGLSSRIARGLGRLAELKRWWSSCPISVAVRARLVKMCVWSLVLYGVEWSRLGSGGMSKLCVFANDCRRSVLGLRRVCRVREEELISRSGLEDVRMIVARRSLKWMEKVDGEGVLSSVYRVVDDGAKRVGRPCYRYNVEYRRWLMGIVD